MTVIVSWALMTVLPIILGFIVNLLYSYSLTA